MKLILITYNEALDGELMEFLESNAVEGYTKWTKVLGRGKASGPHMSTHVWPKANNVLMVAADDELADKVVKGVLDLRQTLSHEGVKAFMVPLLELT